MNNDSFDELIEFLKNSKTQVRFGLENQGHLPVIEAMLDNNESWSAINKAIGWAGDAACENYIRIIRRKTKELYLLLNIHPNFDNETNIINEMIDRHCGWSEINASLENTGNVIRDRYLAIIRKHYKQLTCEGSKTLYLQ